MRDRRRNRALLLTSAVLSVLTLGIAATVLESTPITSSHSVPTDQSGGAEPSVLAVLVQLIDAVLSLFGVETGSGTSGGDAGSWIEVAIAVVTSLRSIALPLFTIGVIATIVLLVRRQFPEQTPVLVVPRLGLRETPDRVSPSDPVERAWPPVEPEDRVSQKWVSMTQQLDVDRPHARTPEEWAAAAVAAGLDEETVATRTDRFRELQYSKTTEPIGCRRDALRESELPDKTGDAE